MTTLKRSDKTRIFRRCMIYLAVSYLLASAGVNGTINPMQYYKNTGMQIQKLPGSEQGEGLVIRLPEDFDRNKMRYLSFRIEEAENYFFMLPIKAYKAYDTHSKEDSEEEISVKVRMGWNTLDLDSLLPEGENWTEVVVQKTAADSEKMILKDVGLSEYERVDSGRMLYVFVSFLVLAAFWECVWWVKERYAN